MTKKIGLLGGTFDPVHLGHLAVAEAARRQLRLTAVIFVPAGYPYFKAAARVSSAEHRVNMLRLALKNKPHFELSLIEIENPGPSYAIDSITKIKGRLGPQDELFFILGWDSLLTFPRWQEPQRLLELCKLVAAPRPGYPQPDVAALEKELPGLSLRLVVMDRPVINISATAIRQRVSQGLYIGDLVPQSVAQYIKEKGLYL